MMIEHNIYIVYYYYNNIYIMFKVLVCGYNCVLYPHTGIGIVYCGYK